MNSRRLAVFAALLSAALLAACLLARPALADEPLVGTWKMISWVAEDLVTKEKKELFGQHPAGLAVFTPEKRIISIFTAEGRQGGSSDADRAKAFQSMYSIAGKYRVVGNEYYVTVEVAHNPAWVGMVMNRKFKIEGNRLTVMAAAEPGGATFGGHLMQVSATYERVTQ